MRRPDRLCETRHGQRPPRDDEPCQSQDMESIDSLAKMINNFKGGLVLVSHDMRLISQVAKEIWICDKKKVERYQGDILKFKLAAKKAQRKKLDQHANGLVLGAYDGGRMLIIPARLSRMKYPAVSTLCRRRAGRRKRAARRVCVDACVTIRPRYKVPPSLRYHTDTIPYHTFTQAMSLPRC